MSRTSLLALGASAAALLFVTATPASAVLTLTPDGVSAGFTLTTFVSGYNFGNYGPIAQGIDSAGHVITGSHGDGRIYVFNDVDGQTLGSAISSTPYVFETGNPNIAMTSLNGHVYGGQLFGGTYREYFDNGASSPLTGAVAGLTNFLGVWGDPTSNLLYAASNSGVVRINPITGAFTVVNAGLFPDGITVSPDGLTLYAAVGGAIQSYNTTTGALIQTFSTGHGPDGTGVIVGGLHNGKVVVNNNDGTVGLLDTTKPNGDPTQLIIIASGGTRGDFVSPDRSNGTLFLSGVTDVHRLSCGPGCSIGGPPPVDGVIPEPSSWALLILGFGAMGAVLRRRLRPALA
jgi:hypothetical protein